MVRMLLYRMVGGGPSEKHRLRGSEEMCHVASGEEDSADVKTLCNYSLSSCWR